jgi:hypothetical protein
MEFLKGAKDLARNPLGIIALFISLIYGFASLLLNSSADKLTEAERWPLILFIVGFPVLVLGVFYKLVTDHHGKLYAPGDFKDDRSFLRTLSPAEQEKRLEKEVKESFGDSEPSDDDAADDPGPTLTPEGPKPTKPAEDENLPRLREYQRFRKELKEVESAVINKIADEYKVPVDQNVGVGGTDAYFDAFLQTSGPPFTFVEVKALKNPSSGMMMLDRILYNAVVADKFFDSKFKLIVAVVYYFDNHELQRVERHWKKRVSKCPADVEVRFIPRRDIKA